MLFDTLIPTALVGSYPQPGWLVNKTVLLGSGPPRVRMKEVWRPDEDLLEEAQDDAALAALHDQERAGIDIVSDGEVRRESYFNHFANALGGIDIDHPGTVPGRTGTPTLVSRITGPIAWTGPVQVRDVEFMKAHTDRPVKVTIPGAFTMAKMALDEHYGDFGLVVEAYAKALNREVLAMQAAGADVIQIDEPHMAAHPADARAFNKLAIDSALAGVSVPTVVHMCFGYAYVVSEKPAGYDFLGELNETCVTAVSIEAAQPKLDPAMLRRLPDKHVLYGVLDLGATEAETPELVAERLRAALPHIDAGRLVAAPDCGLKYLPRPLAFAKLKALAEGAAIVRAKVGHSAAARLT